MNILVRHPHKGQPEGHAEGGEVTRSHRAALPSHNFGFRSSVAGKTTQSEKHITPSKVIKGDGKSVLAAPVEYLPVLCRMGQGNNLSMTMGDTISAGWPVACVGKRDSIPSSIERVVGRRGPTVGLNPSMLLNLPSKGGVGSHVGEVKALAPFMASNLRRAESLTYGQLRRTGQAPGCAANFQSISTAENRNARPFSGDWRRPGMPVRLGQLDSIQGGL